MGKHKYNFHRFFIIDELISTRTGPTVHKMRDQCEFELYGSNTGKNPSEKTVQRDIRTLIDEYDAPIIKKKRDGKLRYYYSNPEYNFLLPFSRSDIENLKLSMSKFRHMRESKIIANIDKAISDFERKIKVRLPQSANKIHEYVYFETPYYIKGMNHFSPIFQAIKEQKIIRFRYHSYTDGEYEVKLHPYLLKEHEKWWYVIGKYDGKKMRTFALDRIMGEIYISKDIFERDTSFDPVEMYRYSFGITVTDGNPVEIILKFEPITANYIKSKPLHPTQKIVNEDQEGLTISFKSYLGHELYRKVLSYGHDVEIIAPAKLKHNIIKRYKEVIAKYQN